MSVEAMTMVTISGPEHMVGTAVKNMVINMEFHPENAMKILEGAGELEHFSSPNPYAGTYARIIEAAKKLKIGLGYGQLPELKYSLWDASEYTEGLLSKIKDIRLEREKKTEKIKNNATVTEQLSHFTGYKAELGDLLNMKYLKFHYGRLPAENLGPCMDAVEESTDVYFVLSALDEKWAYGAYFSLLSNYGSISDFFARMGFEEINMDVSGDIGDTASEIIQRLKDESLEAERRIRALDTQLSDLSKTEREKLLSYYSWLRFENEAFETLSYAVRRRGRFYLIGWIPKSEGADFAKKCEDLKGLTCFFTKPSEMRGTIPPVKLKKSRLGDIFQPFLEMYGLPAYGELDPRIFLSISYTLLFGIMFGDIGQGLSLVIIGLALWFSKKLWLGRILALCGLSSTGFGFVYGSVFGNEHLLPGFKVLEDGNTMKILMVAVVIGVALILISMLMNIITGLRQRDIRKVFFDPNGLAGFVFYMGIAYGVYAQMVLGNNVFTPLYTVLVIAVPIFLIFAAAPITKLLTGQKDWLPKSLGMFFVEGFFEIFETLLSYVSNTVSFLRVGAFAISHAGMMMVVYLLSQGADGGYSLLGLIFGNILVTGLETVLVCIQVMRLEFYEMFGRFYQSGGEKFLPISIDYKSAP